MIPTLNASESFRSDADSAFVKTAGKVTDGLALMLMSASHLKTTAAQTHSV